MTLAAFRFGRRTDYTRPPARCRAARYAWDLLAPLKSMRLVDGLWMGERPDGSLDDVEASLVRQRTRRDGPE